MDGASRYVNEVLFLGVDRQTTVSTADRSIASLFYGHAGGLVVRCPPRGPQTQDRIPLSPCGFFLSWSSLTSDSEILYSSGYSARRCPL